MHIKQNKNKNSDLRYSSMLTNEGGMIMQIVDESVSFLFPVITLHWNNIKSKYLAHYTSQKHYY